jgi:hypothetical protein
MSRVTSVHLWRALSRLRGRSVNELRERGMQAAHSWLERRVQKIDLDDQTAFRSRIAPEFRDVADRGGEAMLARFRAGQSGRFLAAFADRAATASELRARWPAMNSGLLRDAEKVREGKFDLLGYRDLSYGSPIDWHLDPISGRRAPLVHWSQVPYLDATIAGDHKVVWELNRHQHFITLGRAYWATNDEAFADTIAHHVTSWMDQNPPKVGINWASSLEVAFRAISWVWAMHFLRESPALTPELYRRMLVFLDLHGRHVERYLSTYFSPNTHLTGEALGLYVLGQCVPMLAAAGRFRRTGRRILVDQLSRQVRSDGVYVEQSPYYQRYTLDFYLLALALAERCGDSLRPEIAPRLSAAAEHLMYLMRPDRSWPLIGDDDGGQMLPLRGRAANDYRPTLALAAATFGRGDMAACGGSAPEELLWILGKEGLARFDAIRAEYPTPPSAAFHEGGFYVMRNDWSAGSDYAVIDAGDHGFLNAGHAHADALGIDMSLAGMPVFVDPGTGSYTADPAARDYYRGTAVHNTVTVDGLSSSEPGQTAFSWATMARVTVRKWISASSFDFFRGSHDGYSRLPDPATHERSVLFLKGRYWILRDRIESDGPHDIAVHFHCSPSIDVEQVASGEVRLRSAGTLEAQLSVVARDGHFTLTNERVAPVYGQHVGTLGATYVCRSEGSSEILTVIAPEPARVSCPATGMIEVVTTEARDHLLAGSDREGWSAAGITTDAAWAWMRRCLGSNRVTELVLIDVSHFAVDGESILSGGQRLEYVEGRRTDDGWDLRSETIPVEGR